MYAGSDQMGKCVHGSEPKIIELTSLTSSAAVTEILERLYHVLRDRLQYGKQSSLTLPGAIDT